MSDEIQDINFSNMQNETVNEFIALIVALLLANPGVERAMGEELQAAQLAFQSVIHPQTMVKELSLKQVDKLVDVYWRGTRNQLKLSCTNPNQIVRATAVQINNVFTTVADPTSEKYDFQYGALSSLLEKLEAVGEQKLAQAYVLDWVKALRSGVDLYHKLKQEKTEAKSKKKLGVAKEARENVCSVYQSVIKRLNAIMILHPDAEHAELNAKIDQAIADRKLSDKLGKRKPNDKDKDKEAEKPEAETPTEEA